MKKTITLLSIVSLSVLAFGQENPPLEILPSKIGFETGEGYTLGNIDNQEGWKVSDNPYFEKLKRNVVTDELSNNGNNSLKLAYDEGIQSHYNIGAHYFLSHSNRKNIELYIRFSIDEFSTYKINVITTEEDGFGDAFSFSDGYIYIRDWENWADVRTNAIITSDTWYKLNIVYNKQEQKIEYKLDDVVIYTRSNVNPVNFGFNQIDFYIIMQA